MTTSTYTKISQQFLRFLRSEQASGALLIACTVASLTLANSPWAREYLAIWHVKLGLDGGLRLVYTVEEWINDGLMAVFFLLIGLEIERELYVGELCEPKKAVLPILAAIGGMVVPASIHYILNKGTGTTSGFGIPMATDIAFALAALSILGRRVPVTLKIFLTALAIIDDLGAIIVIAVFYVSQFSGVYLLLSLAVFGGLIALNRLGVTRLSLYLVPALAMWYFMLRSGVHPTITGVLLAFAIPFRGGESSPSHRLEGYLHKPVAYIIMPLFALANTAITLSEGWFRAGLSANSLGIFAGLVIGKPLGIAGFSLLSVMVGIARLPEGCSVRHVTGAAVLGGIGFTMSIFIALLAFEAPQMIEASKVAILISSFVAGVFGMAVLWWKQNS